MIKLLVLLHILGGSVAVLGMCMAIVTVKGSKHHRMGGRGYVYGMSISMVLAILISAATTNVFLFFIALFSSYLVFTGWRLATVKNGQKSVLEYRLSFVMIGVALLMGLYGLAMLLQGFNLGIALIVFGGFAFQPAWHDYQRALTWPKGRERINLHLSRMGGACIATVTAVFVVNIQTEPAFIAWLLPSLLGTPLIFYAARKIA